MRFDVQPNSVLYINDSDQVVAAVDFPTSQSDEKVVNINRTFVDESLRGQGIADKLMAQAAANIRQTGRKAIVTCSYAKKWFDDHKEEQDLLA